MHLTIAFDAFLPVARWGPLFHVLCLEQPLLTLEWRPVRFPAVGRSPLDDAEVGLLVEPLVGPGLDSLTIDSSPMAAIMAVGHPLAGQDEISVADILDELFLDIQGLDPRWRAIWTLTIPRRAREAHRAARGGRRRGTGGDRVGRRDRHGARIGRERPAPPGLVSAALRDGPSVATRLVWRSNDDNPIVRALIELAAAWATLRRDRADAEDRGPD